MNKNEAQANTTMPAPNSTEEHGSRYNIFQPIVNLFKPKNDTTLRETIEEYIEDDAISIEEESISVHEKTLISNVLDLRDLRVDDVMVPRADIVAISETTTQKELFELFSEKQYSRIPVYLDTLDNVTGFIHVKDIIATLARGKKINIKSLIRDVPIVSPSMQILDLLLQMRASRKHMALVIDEFGGVDGLITIGDVIESIVGEIDDEYEPDNQPEITIESDGTILADARISLDEFEDKFGIILSDEEREENNTLGGLVFFIAGRIPVRGEVLTHETGMKFEIHEADPRRIKKLYIRDIPNQNA